MAAVVADVVSVASEVTVAFAGKEGGAPPPPPPAPSLTLSSDGAATVGVAEAVTVTAANITAPAAVTVARVSGPAAAIDPVPVTPAPGELSKIAYATAAAVGTLRLQASATIGGSLVQSNAVDVVVGAAPPAPGPLDATLDLIAAAHAAGHMWVRLDDPAGAPTFESVIPPDDLLDFAGGVPNSPRGIFHVWAGWAYNPVTHALTGTGVGHANSSAGCMFSWLATNRGFRLDFNGPELVQVDPYPIYRAKDFNASIVSAHNYSNPVYLPGSGKFFLMPGASYGDGGANKVFDPGISGNQPGLRPVGAWSVDMTLAGQGYVMGTTGSNPARGAYAGVSLPGANASRLHDWFEPSHPTIPIIGGNTYASHIDRGAIAVVEGGKDVVYYTAGSAMSLLRAELHPSDGALDVITREFHDSTFYADGESLGSGNIAFDPVDRVLVSLARGNGSFEPFRFVDLKRPAGTRAWRRPSSPTNQAALKAESKGEPGLVWDPIDGCYVGFCRGSVATPGLSPASLWQVFKPAPDGSGFTPDAGWAVVRRDAPGGSPVPSVAPLSGESFPSIARRFVPAFEDLRVALFATRYQVWAYIPQAWTDPRL